MNPILLENAVHALVRRAESNAVHVHAAGRHLAKALRDVPNGQTALVAGVTGRQWEPWGATTATEANPTMRMTQLAARFPSLRGAPGVLPWNACALDDWSTSASSGEQWAASFLLWVVWDPSGQWRCTPFHLGEAWRSWDEPHRAAALSWLTDPFVP